MRRSVGVIFLVAFLAQVPLVQGAQDGAAVLPLDEAINTTWRGGEFYAHRKGKTVSPKLTLIDENHLKIQVKILFVKKSFVWERVSAP